MASRRVPGQFVPSDVNLANDPAIMLAGPYAELIFRRANEYIKKNKRDGLVLTMDIPIIANGIPGALRHVARLVEVGLWEVDPRGWIVRSYLKWNLSAAEQEEERIRKVEGAATTNHGKGLHVDKPDRMCPKCKEEKRHERPVVRAL